MDNKIGISPEINIEAFDRFIKYLDEMIDEYLYEEFRAAVTLCGEAAFTAATDNKSWSSKDRERFADRIVFTYLVKHSGELDSLQAVEISLAIEEMLNMTFEPRLLNKISTILRDSLLVKESGNKGRQMADSAVNTADSPLGGIDTSLRSVSIPDGKMGGIDFKHKAMASATKYEAMGSFAGLDFSLPKLSSSVLLSFNLDKEQADITRAIDNGIIVSGQRIKEFMAASANRGELEQRRDAVLTWLAKLGILEETTCCTQESSKEYREALVIADSAVI